MMNLFIEKPISQMPKLSTRPFHVTLLTLCSFRDAIRGRDAQIAGSGPHMDHRDPKGNEHYSCGLAKQAITEFLRINAGESIFYGAE